MVTYMDLLRRLQQMGFYELSKPAIIHTSDGLRVVKSVGHSADYEEEVLLVLGRDHLILDIVSDSCEVTIFAEDT